MTNKIIINLHNDILDIKFKENQYFFDINKLEYFYFCGVREDFYFIKFKLNSNEIETNIKFKTEIESGDQIRERLNLIGKCIKSGRYYNDSFELYK